MINVLVTGIGGPTAQGVMRGLKAISGIHITGVDRREINSGIHFCDNFRLVPGLTEEEAYKKAIQKIVEEEHIDIIFPSLHEEIMLYHMLDRELDVEVAVPQSNVFSVLLDKADVYEYLARTPLKKYLPAYFPFADSEELRSIVKQHFSEDKVIVAKQRAGHGALGFALLTDRSTYLKELAAGHKHFVQLQDYYDIPHEGHEMIMEYLDGQEYSVDIYVFEGRVVTAVPRERSGVSSGIVLDGKVTYEKDLIQIASETAEALITTGFINLQFITAGDSYKLTDINPRFCGSQIMSLGAGVNFPYLLIQYQLLNERPAVEPVWGTRMIRYRDQFFIQEDV